MSRLTLLSLLVASVASLSAGAQDQPAPPRPGEMTTTTTGTTATTTTTSSPTGAVSPSEQTVVVPGSPDLPNREGAIRTETPGAGTHMVSGQVVRYQPGISVVLRDANGVERTYPLSSNYIVPPDTHEGSYLTIPVLSGAQYAAPPPGTNGTFVQTSAPGAKTGTTTRIASTQARTGVTVITPSGGTARRSGTASTAAVKLTPQSGTKPYVVKDYDPGKSVTVLSPEGLEFHLRIDRRSRVPEGLASGNKVFIDTRNVHGAIYVRSLRTAS